MFKKTIKTIGIVLVSIFAVIYIAYLASSLYFMNRFVPNTFINGVNVFGMTAQNVASVLTQNEPEYRLEIEDYDGNSYFLDGSDIGYTADYYPAVNTLFEKHNPYAWFMGIYYSQSEKVTPISRFDSEKLTQSLASVGPFEAHDNAGSDVYIYRELGKYFLHDDTRPILDFDKAKNAICNAVLNGSNKVSIADCYSPCIYTPSQQKVVDLFNTIDEYQSTDIMYVDADLVRHLDFTEINNWLLLDDDGLPYVEDGRLAVSTDKVAKYVDSLKTVFETDDDSVIWTRRDGTTVSLPYRGKGYKVDSEKEINRLLSNIYTGNKYERKPIYSQEAPGRGNAIVGDSYVEVDFEHQKLYCYVDGVLKLTSDVVTGNLSRHCDTPAMISTIYFMQKNRTLRGENYASFVYYWMAFYNHYGLHDATWRDKFGGDIYLHAGSHGCVNLPKDVAAKLYDMVHVGTPVVLYYGQEQEEGGEKR